MKSPHVNCKCCGYEIQTAVIDLDTSANEDVEINGRKSGTIQFSLEGRLPQADGYSASCSFTGEIVNPPICAHCFQNFLGTLLNRPSSPSQEFYEAMHRLIRRREINSRFTRERMEQHGPS